MKLIIDIPEDVYKGIIGRECYSTNWNLVKAFEHGVSLDDVKAEIYRAYEDVTMYYCDEEVCSFFASRVCKILNNIGKENKDE